MTEHDKINEELTKAFFNTSFNSNVTKESQEPERKIKKKSSIIKVVIIIVFCLALLGIASFFLINNSAFNININVSQRQETSTFTVGSKKLNFFPKPPLSEKTKDIKDSYENVSVLFDFEYDSENWEIPDWAIDKQDHIATELTHVTGLGSTGNGSLEIQTEFAGSFWNGAVIELAQYISFAGFELISIDIFLPTDAPKGLRGKLIVTYGNDWKFVEMSRSQRLEPGQWNTLMANISDNSMDWKRMNPDETFRSDIRKLALRIESNKPAYSGPIYVDSLTLYSDKKLSE